MRYFARRGLLWKDLPTTSFDTMSLSIGAPKVRGSALPLKPLGNARMADAYSCDSDGPPRPPTFVQIRPPAAPVSAGRKLGILGVGLALVVAVGWAAYRWTDKPPAAPAVTAAAPPAPVTEAPAPQPAPEDLYGELARRAVDAAVAEPPWGRESLMERVSPFDPSVAARMPASAPPADTGSAANAGSFEMAVQLGKGETIGSALKKRGFAADTIADVISALAPHVSLKRLPAGLDMTVEVRPSGEEGAKPILQALTLHPEGRREIKVERNGDGNYAVERQRR